MARQVGLFTELVMQAIVKAEINHSESILKQYKITKRSHKQLIKLLNKTDIGRHEAVIYSYRLAQEFARIINHIKLIIGHLIYLSEGKDVRHLSFKQVREILELSLDHD